MYKVVAKFSNGRISEHVYQTLKMAREQALYLEYFASAEITIFESK